MPPSQEVSFEECIHSGGLNRVYEALSKVSIQDADASVATDKTNIIKIIDPSYSEKNSSKPSMPCAKLSSVVRDRIHRCFVETAVQHIEEQLRIGDPSGLSLHTCNEVAEMLIDADFAYDRARELLTIARAQTLVDGAHPIPVADSLRLLGLTQRHCGNYVEAEQLFVECKNMLDNVGATESSEYTAVMQCIGKLKYHRGDYDAALACFHHVVKAHKESQPSGLHAMQRYAKLVRSIGVIERKRGNLDASIEKIEEARSLLIQSRCGAETSPDFADMLRSLGQAYAMRGELAEALERYGRAQLVYEAAGVERSPKHALVLQHIAGVHLKLGDHRSSFEHYERAKAGLEAVGAHNTLKYASLLKDMAGCFVAEHEHETALRYLETARGVVHHAGVTASPLYHEILRDSEMCRSRLSKPGMETAHEVDPILQVKSACESLPSIKRLSFRKPLPNIADADVWSTRLSQTSGG